MLGWRSTTHIGTSNDSSRFRLLAAVMHYGGSSAASALLQHEIHGHHRLHHRHTMFLRNTTKRERAHVVRYYKQDDRAHTPRTRG